MTALGYFPQTRSQDSVPVVCPACGTAFPVPLAVLRSSKTLGCPSCRHVRPAPTLPAHVTGVERDERLSEFVR